MNDWQIRTLEDARGAADRPLDNWPALELDGRCQHYQCDRVADHVATSARLHMRGLLCADHAAAERIRLDTPRA